MPEDWYFTAFYVLMYILSQICDHESIVYVDIGFPYQGFVLILFQRIF